jgi:hypothetical protein
MNESAFLALEEEAKKRNISLNNLVNQLFLSYANFDRSVLTKAWHAKNVQSNLQEDFESCRG